MNKPNFVSIRVIVHYFTGILFWLFFFSFSLSAVIIFENRKIELMQRMLFAQKLSIQSDPSSEQLLSISLTYLDNDFLAPNFRRFTDPNSNKHIKDSIINKNFSAYINKYETKIFTFDDQMKALHNEEPVSYDTLNTIHRIKGKPTSIAGLHYVERSFDKFSYIFKREVIDTLGNIAGHLFFYSNEVFVIHYMSMNLMLSHAVKGKGRKSGKSSNLGLSA